MTSFSIDSGAFLALLDAGDTYYVAAADFVLANRTATFYLPDTIFSETMVLVKARLGAQAAVELGERMMKSAQFQILYLSPDDRQATWDIFSRYTDKDWSYVDCSLLALARRLDILQIFSFDHHIDQMGLQRVPEISR
jgi:predicted nucleic acid-binding protein